MIVDYLLSMPAPKETAAWSNPTIFLFVYILSEEPKLFFPPYID